MTKPPDALLCAPFDLENLPDPDARYRVPLENPQDEEDAQEIASVNYHAYGADHFTDATTTAEADACYEKFLIDARRMVDDGELERLIEAMG